MKRFVSPIFLALAFLMALSACEPVGNRIDIDNDRPREGYS